MIQPDQLIKLVPDTSKNPDDEAARTFAVCLLLLLPLLISLLILDLANSAIIGLVYGMIGLDLFSLVLVQRGFFRLAVPVMMIGLGLLATLAVFNLTHPDPYAVYMLCVFHLFIIFTAALVSYNKYYLYLSCTLSLLSLILHYIFREIPPPPGGESSAMDDYVLCAGLVLISAVLIHHTLEAKNRLFRKLKTASEENQAKADQLSAMYADLIQALDEKKEMAEKYKLLLQTANEGIFIAQDSHIKFTNQKTLDILGYSEEELTRRPFTSLIHREDQDMVLQRHIQRLKGNNPPSAYAFRAMNRQGEVLWIQIHTVTTLWDKRPATLNFIQDITGHKRMEQQIQQSQKIEAIGTLAGGIAHDFNNLLSGIFAYLQLAEKHTVQPDRLEKDLAQIRLGAEKAADLCRQILLISRKSEPVKQPVVLSGIVKEIQDLLKATLPADIQLRVLIETHAVIHADPGKIHQVILNLCTNAFQAMTGPGLLEIRLGESQVFQDPDLDGRGIPPGPYLVLTVRDTGEGMDPSTLARLFDPYFTTKAPGKGTGLGLAVARGIVEEHNGHIRVFSEKGQGSEFQVFLPRAQGRAEKKAPKARPLEESAPQAHLLVVEDEQRLCQAMQLLLEDQGYQVSATGLAQSALDMFCQDPDRYDLVISDQVLPAMTGTELIQKIKEVSPSTPAILCSGNTDYIARNSPGPADAFIPKPLDTALLTRTAGALIRSARAKQPLSGPYSDQDSGQAKA